MPDSFPFDPDATAALERILAAPRLSRDSYEIVAKSLGRTGL